MKQIIKEHDGNLMFSYLNAMLKKDLFGLVIALQNENKQLKSLVKDAGLNI